MRRDEGGHQFTLDPAPIWPDEEGYLEPIFLPGPLWVGFDDIDPVELTLDLAAYESYGAGRLVEFDDFAPLDPAPADAGAAELPDRLPEERPWTRRQRASAVSVLGSLGVHLLTLAILIGWSAAPAAVPGAMPVQLVLEASATANEAPAGESLGENIRDAANADDAAPPPEAPPAAPPAPMPPPPAATPAPAPTRPPPPKLAAAPVRPKPPPRPKPVAAPAPATPQIVEAAPRSPPPPKRPSEAPAPSTPSPPTPVQTAAAEAPRPASAPGVAAGSARAASAPRPAIAAVAAGHGDYLNQLVVLTRGHLDILPMSFLAGRRGRTTLSVLVIEDGTIGRISVKRSSGYPDIDAKIEQMVAAVGRFPPVPASLPRPSVELDFDMSFPDAVQQ